MESAASKIFGTLKAIVNVFWIGLGVVVLIYGIRSITWVNEKSDDTLTAVIQNIDIVNDLLIETIDVIEMVDETLSTLERSIIDAGLTMNETTPMIQKTSKIVVQDVPQALDDVQSSMPGVIEAAAAIDQTLRILSNFKISIPIPFGSDYEISLGVDYDPEVPLDDALIDLSGNLEEIPDSMRAIESDLITADTNLEFMSQNLLDVAQDIDLMREQIADINPEIKNLISSFEVIQASLNRTQERIPVIMTTTQKVFTGIIVLFIAGQIPSLYIGLLLIRGGYPLDGEEKKGDSYV